MDTSLLRHHKSSSVTSGPVWSIKGGFLPSVEGAKYGTEGAYLRSGQIRLKYVGPM